MKAKSLPLILITLVFVGVFANTVINLQLSDIRANWSKRRCEGMVIAMAHLVPDGTNPKIKPTEFAIDNFYFCMNQLADFSLNISLSPVLSAFKVQLDATNPISNSMNYLRSNALSLLTPINKFFQDLWDRMKMLMTQITIIFKKLHSAFERVQGVILAAIFAGFSVITAILNILRLVLWIIQMIIAIMIAIMIIMMLLSFFVPGASFMATMIIGTIGAISTMIQFIPMIMEAEAVSGQVSSAIGFTNMCVAKGTLVACASGLWKPVEELKPGDALRSGTVEGVLKVSAKGGKCVRLHGVIISDVHLVFDGEWKHAGKHPLAQVYEGEEEFLYCLNTSDHTWVVKGSEELLLRDWQEVDTLAGWEDAVFAALNPVPFPHAKAPGRGLLGKATMVWEKTKGPIRISEVAIGDFVKDGDDRYTEVVGVYADCATGVPLVGPNAAAWVSEAGRCVSEASSPAWTHRLPFGRATYEMDGRQLITASGFFMVFPVEKPILVRDFTEVGLNHVLNTDYAVKFLNTL